MPNHDRFECQTAIDSDAILHITANNMIVLFFFCEMNLCLYIFMRNIVFYSDKNTCELITVIGGVECVLVMQTNGKI